MPEIHSNKNYDRAVEIAKDIYWIGFFDTQTGLHCNPYLIIDNDEAIVIDGGSRPDFATVMMKILQTGISLSRIKALIYQHYDPDLCGSIPNFEDIIENKDLNIISAEENFIFIQHYSTVSKRVAIDAINSEFTFSSGRTLKFIRTPYSHSQGSFVTYDPASGILFSSDLFGSISTDWELYLNLKRHCIECADIEKCGEKRDNCPVKDILIFHQQIMPSEKALKYALTKILEIPFRMVAPQHGSVIEDKKVLAHVIKRLISLEKVGIDAIVGKDFDFDFTLLEERFLNR